MQTIVLTQGKVAMVDDADYELLSQHKWWAQESGKTFYALGWHNRTNTMMHRWLLGIDDPKAEVDHRNGNGLDNRRENLRICTKRRNHQNQSLRSDSRTGFKGVRQYRNRRNLWRAMIHVDGQRVHLGCFKDPEAAARAYDAAAREHFGEFARVNFPAKADAIDGNW